LVSDPQQVEPPLLARYLVPDGQIVRFVLNDPGIDPRLASFAEHVPAAGHVPPAVPAAGPPLTGDAWQALVAFAQHAVTTGQPLRLYFEGPRGAGKHHSAEALAAGLGLPLLAADLARAAALGHDAEPTLKVLFREARLTGAVLYLDALESLGGDEHQALRQGLWRALAASSGPVILGGTQAWLPLGREPLGVISIPFSILTFEQRRACWQTNLAAAGISLAADDLDALSGRFRLTRGQIAESVAVAASHARWRAATDPASRGSPPALRDLFAVVRAQSGHELARLAHKIDPVHTWDDIVLPADTLAQLHEICERVAHGHRVLDEWGFGRKLSLGKGLTALFSGPSGTGKTMAAGIISNELGLDLYKIDLSQVVSKYIGETEKNLDRIFSAAEASNAVLFFDEADALFGKRSQVKDSHDRYANVEISYLLQKMEEHDGIAILATNLHNNMDEAFVRRLAFMVPFPFPEEEDRLRIWLGIWPRQMPRAANIDLEFLARQFKLAGGNIKNIALAAAFLAAEDGQVVGMDHLVSATKRELQKMRKAIVEREFGPYARGAKERT
jgi:SpoVK/Ycf46/Vps4 family AAA+-type ATPase